MNNDQRFSKKRRRENWIIFSILAALFVGCFIASYVHVQQDARRDVHLKSVGWASTLLAEAGGKPDRIGTRSIIVADDEEDDQEDHEACEQDSSSCSQSKS